MIFLGYCPLVSHNRVIRAPWFMIAGLEPRSAPFIAVMAKRGKKPECECCDIIHLNSRMLEIPVTAHNKGTGYGDSQPADAIPL
jgi:hypothetical protein